MTGRSRLSCGDSALLVAAGSSIGSLYYVMMSTSIPTGANCSFSANIWTDILAFAVGFGLLYLGATHETAAAPPSVVYQALLLAFGTAIVTEHVWQLFDHKL